MDKMEVIQFSGPSDGEMPKGLPPFLLNCDVMAVDIGWKVIEGPTPVTALIAMTSSLKMFVISVIKVALFLTMRAQYVWL
jgi:hypothetical protein